MDLMDGTKLKVTQGMRKVLRAIDEGKPHRASWTTYEALTVAKLAVYVAEQGWTLLPAGSQLVASMKANS